MNPAAFSLQAVRLVLRLPGRLPLALPCVCVVVLAVRLMLLGFLGLSYTSPRRLPLSIQRPRGRDLIVRLHPPWVTDAVLFPLVVDQLLLTVCRCLQSQRSCHGGFRHRFLT